MPSDWLPDPVHFIGGRSTELQRLKALPKPDHKEAAQKRDAALAQAEAELTAEIREIFLKHDHDDERFGT